MGRDGRLHGRVGARRRRRLGPRTWAGLISGKRNISAISQSAGVGGGLSLGLSVFTPAPPSGK